MNAELTRTVDALRTLIAGRLSDLTSRPSPALVGRQLAAGALARALVLFEGLLELVAAGRGDAAGGLLRSIYELELFGLYVLLGGPEAVLATMGDYSRAMKVFHERDGSEQTLLLQLWQGRPPLPDGTAAVDQRLNYEALALKVAELLRKRGDSQAEAAKAQSTYDILYRAESMFSTHATLASVGPYVDLHGDPWRLRDRSSIHDSLTDEDRIVLASGMTAHLAAYVFEAFGFSRTATDELWRAVDALPGRPA